ncbi:TATA box-binding protein-associated factor RNA polymerase I subunit A isoform X3 [Rhinoderma darwinii]
MATEENDDCGTSLPSTHKTNYPEIDIATEEDEDYGINLPRTRKIKSCTNRLKSCHVTSDLCLQLIHQTMYKNQWEKAAGLLIDYLQTLEDRGTTRQRRAPEIIWRLGSEILLNHPKSTNKDINVFHETMKNIGLTNYLSISLEQVYHNLCNGETDEGYRVLSVAESWRNGQHSIKQRKLQKLIEAYKAVLNHRSWVDIGSTITQNELDYSCQTSAFQSMDSYYRQATVTFHEIIKSPGVWDPFVLSYVDLLEFSGEKQEAEKVLTAYASNVRNPANPNAHVYLYEFMKRNQASDEKLIKVLRVLHDVTPSHKLMLIFSKLLDNSDSVEDKKLALHVLFNLLDFSGWKKDVTAWSYLGKQLKNTVRHDHNAWVLEAWQPRKSWWPSYHFTKLHAMKDCQESAELYKKKALVAGLLQGAACVYFTWVYAFGKKEQKTTLNHMKKFIKKFNIQSPGNMA